MSAGSFPELFLQYFGWGIYNILWDVLVNLGIVYIPFGYYLFDAFTDARKKASGNKVSQKVLHNLEVKIFLGVVVLTLAGVPTLTLNLNDMKYNELICKSGSSTPTINQIKASKTGTTFDGLFTTGSMGSLTAKAPIVWMGVLSISQAINDGVRVKIPCKSSLSQVAYELKINNIKDPNTKQEVADFYRTCFKPARAQFSRELPSSYTKTMQSNSDAEWLGSQFFLTEKGYYDKFQSPNPVPGLFAFDENGRDKGLWNGQPPKPKWGKPYCKEWYEHKTKGIRAKIINELTQSEWTELGTKLSNWSSSTTEVEDALIRTMVDVSQVKTIPQRNYGQNLGGFGYDIGGLGAGITTNGIANAGTYVFSPVYYSTLLILKKALPLIHAMLFMGLIIFLPLLLILSQYGVKEVFTMSALFFSVKLWPVIWAIGAWMQASLEEAFLPNLTQGMLTSIDQAISINDDVLDYTIGAWYIMGPIILSTVVTLAGLQTGSAINEAMNANKSGDGAGKAGGSSANKAISKGIR